MVFLLALAIVGLDQYTKYLAISHLKGKNPIIIIDNFFQFIYVENRGAAFGILQQKKFLFIIITLVAVGSISFYLITNYYEINKIARIGLGLLLGGAIGNLLDRIRFGYVVDFISFRLFNGYDFPVFNIADIAIVCSTFIIVLLVFFDGYEV